MPLADESHEEEFWDTLFVREVWEIIDALPDEERTMLLKWLGKWREGQPIPERIQRIVDKVRAALGVTAES